MKLTDMQRCADVEARGMQWFGPRAPGRGCNIVMHTKRVRRESLPAKRSRGHDRETARAGANIDSRSIGRKTMGNAKRLLAGLWLVWLASSAAATVTEVAQSAAAGASSVATKVERAVARGVNAATSGIERGGKATGNALQTAARKIGIPGAGASSPKP
jgi:hypothetical protein